MGRILDRENFPRLGLGVYYLRVRLQLCSRNCELCKFCESVVVVPMNPVPSVCDAFPIRKPESFQVISDFHAIIFRHHQLNLFGVIAFAVRTTTSTSCSAHLATFSGVTLVRRIFVAASATIVVVDEPTRGDEETD